MFMQPIHLIITTLWPRLEDIIVDQGKLQGEELIILKYKVPLRKGLIKQDQRSQKLTPRKDQLKRDNI